MIDRRNISNLYPLSSLQEGMLYHALREPESRAYFEQIDFEIPGALDAAAWLQAWQDLVNRHDILRTVFAVRKLPQPLQIVLRNAPLAQVHEDLQTLSDAEANARIAAWRADDLAQGFDLTAAVPMRLALFTLSGERHRVVWSFHHILLDGWSLAILQSDLDALYAARLAGRVAPLPPPAPYAAYIKWLGKRERQQGLAFWQDKLQQFAVPTPLPRRLDAHFLHQIPPYTSGECRHPLGLPAQQALPRLAAAHGVTVNLVVQCLWGMLLARLNGRRDAAFAATVSGRPTELENANRTVGLFINAVPVRVRLHPGESLAALLARMQAESIEAQTWHDCPLAEVQAAHPLRDTLFDHILVFENYPQLDQSAQPATPDAVSLHEYTHYHFEFQFLPGSPPVLRFRFHAGLFDAAQMAKIAQDFEALLLAAAAEPQRPAEQLALQSGMARWQAPASVAIAASFTAEPIAEALAWWLAQFACPTGVQLAPYNQCLQQLGDPRSVLQQSALGVLLLRFADAARDLAQLPPDEARASLDAQYEALLSLLRQRGGKALLVGLLPHAAQDDALDAHIASLEQRWRKEVQAIPGITLLDLRQLAATHDLDELFDSAADRIGHLPYSPQAFDAIAAGIARAVVTRSRPPFKVIAVDCDNTLWAGVAGEAGPLGVRIDAGHRALQQFLLEKQEQGFLLALASKNQEQDVWAVFEQNPGMLLRREHIAAAAINWQPKSGNLKQLAATLNLGVDSIVFLDDSPLECSEVMEHCPEALAIPLPADPDLYAPWLARVWAFDVMAVTAEDRERTGMMLAESRRQATLSGIEDNDPQAFLEQLQLRVKVGPAQPHQIARVAQLTQRTNQFNLNGKCRDEAQIAALIAEPGVEVLAVEVDDHFGAYGLTGVAITRSEDNMLQIDTLLLSCRVLGRRVEAALLRALARRALALGHSAMEARVVRTGRNEPVCLFLSGSPWTQAAENLFRCVPEQAAQAVTGVELLDNHAFIPLPSPTSGRGAGREDDRKTRSLDEHALPQSGESAGRQWGAFPLPIRNEARLKHGPQYLPLLAACAGWPRTRLQSGSGRPRQAGKGRPPAPGTEQEVAAIWAEVLGAAVGDAECSFSELGGHSLHAVRALSRLERAFRREIGLSTFFSLGTVAALAAWLDAQPAADTQAAPATIPAAPERPDYPLSHNQQRLWILSRMGAADNLYNLCAAFRLRGALKPAALRHAVQQLVERHEALRTVFRLIGDEPRQIIVAPHADSFIVHAEVAGQQEDAIHAQIVARGRLPFDLEAGPLFRVELYPLGSEDQVLTIHLHHIIGDGWSFGMLLDDLAHAYAAALDQTAAAAQPPALRYRDFAVWNRSPQCEAGLARHRDYWRAQLQPLAPIAQIPPDFPRPAAPDGEGGAVMRLLPVTAPALNAWLAQHHTTLFPLLASLVALLLYRCGGEPAVRLGMPVAGRDRPELERTVGFFANTTVLSAQLAPHDNFTALLAAMQQRVTEALDHQAYPFDRLVADLQPERESGRNPLFDAVVVLQNARDNNSSSGSSLPGIAVSDFAVDTGLAAFDLVFEFGPAETGELACALRYRRALYRDDSAQRLLDRLMTLLASVLADPSRTLHALPLIGTHEQRQLATFRDGGARPIPEATLPALFAAQAARNPGSIALCAGDTALDYRTLDRRANALAWHLRRTHRVTEGQVVGVLLERNADWPIVLLAAMKAGAVYLPLDLRHPPARLRELLAQADARALIVAPENQPAFAGLDLHFPAPLDASAQEDQPPPCLAGADDPAYLLFTSGSTGKPKGVLVQHRAFVNMILEQIRGFAITPDDTVLHLASCAFDASLSEFFMAWLCGARVALTDHASARDGALLAQAIAAQRATVATFTPSHLRQLDDAEIAGLRKIILAAEAVLGRDARRLQALGIECFNAYGPTETAVCATLTRIDAVESDTAAVPIGGPLANLTLRIVDAAGCETPLGVSGEIVVSGAGVALGYLNPPDGSGSPFFTQADGTRGYRTGDIGRWRADGRVEYLGRKDAQVKIRGHRVEPAEIGAALGAIEGIRQAEVIVESAEAGDFLVACLSGRQMPDALLRARLADSLPPHMLPARFVWLERLPLTTSGKLDRAALPALAGPAVVADDDPGTLSGLESALLARWRGLLPGAVDIDTDFFAAGGNSLLAMRAARRISQELGRPCPALQFFKTPTVRAMASALEGNSGGDSALLHTFGAGALQVIALPSDPAFGLAYTSLSHEWPEATIHAARFADKPIAELVDLYAQAFLHLNLQSSAVLLGYSAGGKLALALAHALEKRGVTLKSVVLIDTWQWAQAAPEIHAMIDAERTAAAPATAGPVTSYRTQTALFIPPGPIQAPLHHLLGDAGDAPLPAGVSRDWRPLAATTYREHALGGEHHALLDAAHAAHAAACLRTILNGESSSQNPRQQSP